MDENKLLSPVSVRVKAALVHLLGSVLVAAASAILVFVVWYPYPYSHISGGRALFGLLVAVDVVVGPLITLLVFASTKSRRELMADMCVVVTLQLSALTYGMWTMYQARPVQLVYEYGRFGVATAVEVDLRLVPQVLQGTNLLPLDGPGLVALRPTHDSAEKAQVTMAALSGAPLAARVDLWLPYDQAVPDILARAQRLPRLRERFPDELALISTAVRNTRLAEDQLRYLPMAARGQYWTVLLHRETGRPIAYIHLDAFE